MSWDYRVDGNGNLEIEVRRWYNGPPPRGREKREVLLVATGFEPNEPVSVEVLADDGEGRC